MEIGEIGEELAQEILAFSNANFSGKCNVVANVERLFGEAINTDDIIIKVRGELSNILGQNNKISLDNLVEEFNSTNTPKRLRIRRALIKVLYPNPKEILEKYKLIFLFMKTHKDIIPGRKPSLSKKNRRKRKKYGSSKGCDLDEEILGKIKDFFKLQKNWKYLRYITPDFYGKMNGEGYDVRKILQSELGYGLPETFLGFENLFKKGKDSDGCDLICYLLDDKNLRQCYDQYLKVYIFFKDVKQKDNIDYLKNLKKESDKLLYIKAIVEKELGIDLFEGFGDELLADIENIKSLEKDFSIVRNNLKRSILDICNLFGWNFNGEKKLDNLSEKFHGVCADDFVRFKENGKKTGWPSKRLVQERVMDVERSVSEAVDLIQKNRTDLFKILCSTGNVSVPKNFVLKYSEKEMNLFLDSVLEKYEKGNWMEKRGAKINLIKFLISDFVGIEFALSVVGSELYNYFAEDLKDKVGLTFINFQAFLKDKNNWKYTKRFTGVKYKIDCDDVRFAGIPLTLGEILEKKFMGNVPLKLESLLKVFGINTIESDWYVLFNDETNWVEEYQWYVLLCNKIVKFFTSSRSGTSVVSLGEDEMKEIKGNLEKYILSDENKNIKDEIKTNIEIINMAIEDAGAEVYIYNLGSLKFSEGWQNKKE